MSDKQQLPVALLPSILLMSANTCVARGEAVFVFAKAAILDVCSWARLEVELLLA